MKKQLLFILASLLLAFSTNKSLAQCQAAFTLSNTGASYTFTDGSTAGTGTISNWFWSFGDGQTANTQNASYTYTSCGTYTVTLGIFTSGFCSNSYSTTVNVSIPVNGSFTANDGGGGNFTFTPSPFNGNYTYVWNYGDSSPLDTTNFAFHTYASGGTYNVCVNFDDGAGCTDYVCQQVIVNTTGIKQNEKHNPDLYVYPNPSGALTNIEFTLQSAGKINLAIFDLLGNKVADLEKYMNAGKQQVCLNTEELGPGAYFIKLNTQEGTSIKRLVKD
ncbi:MAG: PKD domain-containing protein [Bacteroidia bacterium]